ncbi:hypothetical protein HOB10_01950 [Candidatus Parcubacteria bacterium]|jgi:hypothetical protein|nr:hypothetical protein [Candidatus Parcubacteria bacterium]
MKVALYTSHHSLPFWHDPKNPYALFDPKAIEGWTCDSKNGVLPAEEHSVMPILNGLLALDIPGATAHVSIILNPHENTVEYGHRCWVQITTEAEEIDNDDLPIVVREGEVLVAHLWGGDNATYTPYQLLDKDPVEGERTPDFWAKFFLEKLQTTKERACKRARSKISEAEETLRYYDLIPEREKEKV